MNKKEKNELAKKRATSQKWVAILKSESGDDYEMQFEGKKPETDKEWLKLFKKHIDNEDIYDNFPNGPGVAGTWLHVERLVAVK